MVKTFEDEREAIRKILAEKEAADTILDAYDKVEDERATGATLAIHLAIHALDNVVETLLPLYGADCPVAVVAHVSQPQQRIVRGTLGDICAALAGDPIERTALILVGRALAAEDFRESALYDPDYRRRYREGPA